MSSRLKLGKQEKIRRSHQFQAAYSRARRLSGAHLTVFFTPNNLTYNRLGLSVSKRRFKLSVRRHYLLRRLREAYRLNKMHFAPGFDIVISAQRFDLASLCWEDLKTELLTLAQKAGLLKR
jgi:ribonuclease P protein component